ncbi:MAG: molybdopterin-dependent oxidoreductase [Caldilineales bacterium]|nr:molybdopterin-dependent oxidoreductase [Caldilineales bacterium]
MDTGHIHVLRLWSVNDVGYAINPQLVEGRSGAVAQSIRLDDAGGSSNAAGPRC